MSLQSSQEGQKKAAAGIGKKQLAAMRTGPGWLMQKEKQGSHQKSAVEQTTAAVAAFVETVAAAVAVADVAADAVVAVVADHCTNGDAAEAEPVKWSNSPENSEESHFVFGTAVISAYESEQAAHQMCSVVAGIAREIESLFWMNQLSSFPEVRQLPLLGKDQVVHLVLKKYQALVVSRVQLQILGSLTEFLDLQPPLETTSIGN